MQNPETPHRVLGRLLGGVQRGLQLAARRRCRVQLAVHWGWGREGWGREEWGWGLREGWIEGGGVGLGCAVLCSG